MTYSRLYFAYGDNMNENVVRNICPGVTFEGVAELKGYRITFNSEGQITIVPDNSSSVWGVVWCLSLKDIHLLDQKEEEMLGAYEKKALFVNFLDGRTAEAFLYLTDVGKKPSLNNSLMDFLIEQAQYWALPTAYISYLKQIRGSNG